MKKLVIFSFIILLANTLRSQDHLFIGAGLAVCHDYFVIFDPGNNVVTTPRPPGMMLSIDIRRKIKEAWFIETGVFLKGASQGFGFSGYGYSGSNAAPAINVPIRLIPKLEIIDRKLYFNPLIGISFGYNSNYGKTSFGTGFTGRIKNGDTTNSVSYKYDNDYNFTKVYTLFQIGISLEFVSRNNSRVILQSNYYSGQQKILQTNISYHMNKEPGINAMIISNGSFWQVLGVTYLFPLGNRPSIADEK